MDKRGGIIFIIVAVFFISLVSALPLVDVTPSQPDTIVIDNQTVQIGDTNATTACDNGEVLLGNGTCMLVSQISTGTGSTLTSLIANETYWGYGDSIFQVNITDFFTNVVTSAIGNATYMLQNTNIFNQQLNTTSEVHFGNITINSTGNLTISGLLGCDTIDTDSVGRLICGTDATGGLTSAIANETYWGYGDTIFQANISDFFTNVITSTIGNDTYIIGNPFNQQLNTTNDVTFGNITISNTGNLTISGLLNCNTIDTDSVGRLICGSDEGGLTSAIANETYWGYGDSIFQVNITDFFTNVITSTIGNATYMLKNTNIFNQQLNTTNDVTFGNITISNTGNLTLSGLLNCDTVDTDSVGRLICGVDGTGGTLSNLSFSTISNNTYARIGLNNQTILDITNITNFLFNYNQTDAVFTDVQLNASINQLVIANETPRFGNLVLNDCPAGTLVIGVQVNGTVLCASDANSGGVISNLSFSTISNNTYARIGLNNQTILDITNITNFIFNYNQTAAVFIDPQFNTSVNQLVIANETPRFGNLVLNDCGVGTLVIGVQVNGTVLCATDAGGGTSWNFAVGTIFNDTSLTNVGIGTATPTSKLHINLSGSVSPLNITFDDLTSVMFIDSNGDIGIGTSTPIRTIDILKDDISIIGIKISNPNDGAIARSFAGFNQGTTFNHDLNIGVTDIDNTVTSNAGRASITTDTTSLGITIGARNTATPGDIRFYAGINNPATEDVHMILAAGGLLSLGNVTPTQQLQIAKNLSIGDDQSACFGAEDCTDARIFWDSVSSALSIGVT